MPARSTSTLAAALLVVLLAAPACSRFQIDEGVQVDASNDGVLAAAGRTIEIPTGAYRAIYTFTVIPSDTVEAEALDGIEVQVDGTYDREADLRTAELDPDSETGIGSAQVGDITTVTDPAAGVVHAQLEPGAPWTPIPYADVPPLPGGLRHATVDVGALLRLAANGGGEVSGGGQSQVGGVDTARLVVEKPLGAGVQGDEDAVALQAMTGVAALGPLLETQAEYELFIDGDGRVRRVVGTFDLLPVLTPAAGPVETANVRVQVDLFDLGSSPPVTLPTAEAEGTAGS
jgi:hypothetical protein